MQKSPTGPASHPSEPMQLIPSPPPHRHARWEPPVLCFGALIPSLVTYVYFCLLAESRTESQLWAYGIAKSLMFSLPVMWVGWIGREKFPWGRASRGTWLFAIAFGLAVVGAMFTFYEVAKHSLPELAALERGVQAKIRGLGMTTPLRYFALSVFYTVCHSFLEEYYWRWFIHHRLRAWFPMGLSVLLSSAAFALHHIIVLGSLMGWDSPWPYLLSVSVAIGGAVWAGLYDRSGSILPGWLSHAIVDGGIFWLGARICASIW
jgi:uncharacterized protein